MKSEPIRLAWLFREAGMIDEPTFEAFTQGQEPKSKSFMDIMKTDITLKGIRDILTMEIDLGMPKKSPDKKSEVSLHSALSQPLHLSQAETKGILSAWKPSVAGIIETLHNAGAISESVEDVMQSLGKGNGLYGRLVEKGYVDSKILNQALSNGSFPLKQMNRLLLALNLLKFNGILEPDDCEEILKNVQTQGLDRTPRLNDEIISFIESEPDLPEIDLAEVDPLDTLRKAFPVSVIRQSLVLPIRKNKNILEIASADPFDTDLIDTLSFLTGVPVVSYCAPTAQLIHRIQQLFPQSSSTAIPPKEEAAHIPPASYPRQQQEAVVQQPVPAHAISVRQVESPMVSTDEFMENRSAVELVSSIIEGGVQNRATDVHLEPRDSHLRVRYRIDGRLHDIMKVPSSLTLSVISRIKVLSNLDVTERRRPQDGHFSLDISNNSYDFRVSTLPTHTGEKIVTRILDSSRVMYDLQGLGMEENLSNEVRKWISRPHGLVLVTGPTGCGKTSTLYAAINTINNEAKNIVTIEDPVEYQLDGISQVQVDPNIELSFAAGLRSILRQDPDVIMVGEIRDQETARIAMRAALTGHLVFSTLHANTAVGAIATLRHMGIEPYMMVSALSGIIGKRLIRVLCPQCKEAFTPTKEMLMNLRMDPKSRKKMYRAKGCDACLGTGYRGRMGAFEVFPMSDPVSIGVIEHKSESELIAIAKESGYQSMMENAICKLQAGITSPEEVLETMCAED